MKPRLQYYPLFASSFANTWKDETRKQIIQTLITLRNLKTQDLVITCSLPWPPPPPPPPSPPPSHTHTHTRTLKLTRRAQNNIFSLPLPFKQGSYTSPLSHPPYLLLSYLLSTPMYSVISLKHNFALMFLSNLLFFMYFAVNVVTIIIDCM